IWSSAEPNLKDLAQFLTTETSAMFDSEKILGRWVFDLNGAVALLRKNKPNITPVQVAQQRNYLVAAFGKASFVAAPRQEVFLKNVPPLRPPAGGAAQFQTYQGQWKNTGGKYEVSLTVDGRTEESPVEMQGDRVALNYGNTALSFMREN